MYDPITLRVIGLREVLLPERNTIYFNYNTCVFRNKVFLSSPEFNNWHPDIYALTIHRQYALWRDTGRKGVAHCPKACVDVFRAREDGHWGGGIAVKRASSRQQPFGRDANPIGPNTICSIWLKFGLASFTPPNLTNRTCIPPSECYDVLKY